MVLAALLLDWPGQAGALGLGGDGSGGFRAGPRRWLPGGGPCAPPGVRFADPSGVVVTGAAGCAVSDGLRGFMLEFTLL